MALAAEQFIWLLVAMGVNAILMLSCIVWLYKNREGKK